MDDGIFGIDEMKTATEDIKKLWPIQEAIMVALMLCSWEEIPDVLRLEATASNLARFMISQPIIRNWHKWLCLYVKNKKCKGSK